MKHARIVRESLRSGWMRTALGIFLALPFAIALTLAYNAWPFLSPSKLLSLVSGSEWAPMHGKFGLWPFIAGSLIITFMGLLMIIPVCLASAIYVTQFSSRWVSRVLRSVIDVLSGIPSVIFGVWGIITIVPMVAGWAKATGSENISGYAVLSAGIVMAVATMPFVLNVLIELFETLSSELRESVMALGASKWQLIRDVVLKALRPGIIAAFTLGVSRGFGETIAVLMVVGNVVQVPRRLFDPAYPLPALLANNYGEMMSIPSYESALMLSALVLMVIVVGFNFIAHMTIRHYQLKM